MKTKEYMEILIGNTGEGRSKNVPPMLDAEDFTGYKMSIEVFGYLFFLSHYLPQSMC
jgi:hypothetical protein